MKGLVISAGVVALGLVIAGYFAGGRYELLNGGSGTAFVLDRRTGEVRWCDSVQCYVVTEKR